MKNPTAECLLCLEYDIYFWMYVKYNKNNITMSNWEYLLFERYPMKKNIGSSIGLFIEIYFVSYQANEFATYTHPTFRSCY